jgi:hypothetical protein
MNFAGPQKLLSIFLLLGVLSGTGAINSRGQSALDVNQIIQKAVNCSQASSKPEDANTAYTYTKVTLTEELDSAGRVKDQKEKVYQISFKQGLTQAKLLQVNGRPPANADAKQQAENESNARQMLGKGKPQTGDMADRLLTPELVARFDFTLIGQTNINGRLAYQIDFQPKSPEPPVHHMIDRFLNRVSGTLWIDAAEFEIARADLRLSSEVNVLGGVIGSLKKLAYTMTRTRIAEGIWLNTSSSGDFEGRKLIDSMRIKTKSLAKNFRLLS